MPFNAGASLKGITAWSQLWKSPGKVTDHWEKAFKYCKFYGVGPDKAKLGVTVYPAVGLVNLYMVDGGPVAKPADCGPFVAEKKALLEIVIGHCAHYFPNAILHLTTNTYPGYATGQSCLTYPWRVKAEEDAMRQLVAEQPANGPVLLFTPNQTNGVVVRPDVGTNTLASDLVNDGIHMVAGVDGVGYRKFARRFVERHFDNPAMRMVLYGY